MRGPVVILQGWWDSLQAIGRSISVLVLHKCFLADLYMDDLFLYPL